MAEVTPPSPLLWGLDPLFRNFVKMYISDVLFMNECTQTPGVYWYKQHPITKVDIMGMVVRVEQKHKFWLYAIDDGTGVISCLCWKPPDDSRSAMNDAGCGLPRMLQTKLQKTESSPGHALGTVLHMRGRIKVYKDTRELVASYCRPVIDPYEEVSRMMELPDLYTQFYDPSCALIQTFNQGSAANISQISITSTFERHLLAHLHETKSSEFSLTQLQQDCTFTEKLFKELPHEVADADYIWSHIASQGLSHLENLGFIYHSTEGDSHYKFVPLYKQLADSIVMVLKRECVKDAYCEKGCHYWHILRELRQSLRYAHLGKEAVLKALGQLEAQSDVVSTADDHFIVFDI